MRRVLLRASTLGVFLGLAFSGAAWAHEPSDEDSPGAGTDTGGTGESAEQRESYSFTLAGLNGSGASGQGSIVFGEDGVTVSVQASGLDPGQTHEMHVHGIEGRDATCPTDTDGDGMVGHEEAERASGGHVLNLEPYQTADEGGNIAFEQTYTEGVENLSPVEERVIMVHGATMNGEFAAKMPAACGEILPAGSTGSPLPDTGGISPVALYGLAGALALIAGLLRNSRRRA
jgi:hypothetical protein